MSDPRTLAEKLAAMATDSGPEGDGAKIRLDRLVQQHPALAWMTEPDALAPTDIEVAVPSWSHLGLLSTLCERLGCDLTGGGVEYTISGPKGYAAQVHSLYQRHAGALSAVMDVAAEALLARVELPEPRPRLDDTTPPDGTNDPSVSAMYRQYAHIEQALRLVPRDTLNRAAARLVDLVMPAVDTPTTALPGRAKAWNDPSLTYDEFVQIHNLFFPKSSLPSYRLEYMYRDGLRLYPPTRRYRTCPDLTRPETWTPGARNR